MNTKRSFIDLPFSPVFLAAVVGVTFGIVVSGCESAWSAQVGEVWDGSLRGGTWTVRVIDTGSNKVREEKRIPDTTVQPNIEPVSTEAAPFGPIFEPSAFLEIDPVLINIGRVAWDLITNNQRPIGVDFNRIQAHALPVGVVQPMDLYPWTGPASRTIEMSYQNYLGMDVFRAVSKISYYYGAPYQGRGRHIANVTVSPDNYSSLIGFTGNVGVRTSTPVYKEGRIASMVVTIDVGLRGPIDNISQSRDVEIRGDGVVSEL